jgi:hypothetical protein
VSLGLLVLAGLAGAAPAPLDPAAEDAARDGGSPDAAEDAGSEGPRLRGEVSGHVKTFAIGTLFYDLPPATLGDTEVELLPEDPLGQGFVDARLNLAGGLGDHLSGEAAHAVTFSLGQGAQVNVIGTGVAPQAPQLVDLGWEAWQDGEGSLAVLGRTDRLLLKGSWDGLDVTVGRQAVSFGAGLFFTPLDLVAPFNPAVIDTEYKPGVDGLRVDVYRGFSTKGTLIATWAGPPVGSDAAADDGLEGLETVNLAAHGVTTVGVTDLAAFAGLVQGDAVGGASLTTSVGAVGLYGDVAVTGPLAEDGEDPFVRAVIGASGRPWWRLDLAGEVYLQTLGSTDKSDLLMTLQRPRWQRGELWLAGVAYAGVSASLEITPLVSISAASIVNLTDPSGFLSPSLRWSLAENADLIAGAYVGLGARPEVGPLDLADPTGALVPRSEFGLYPAVGFLQVRTYY